MVTTYQLKWLIKIVVPHNLIQFKDRRLMFTVKRTEI
jgi:hypothetical protein